MELLVRVRHPIATPFIYKIIQAVISVWIWYDLGMKEVLNLSEGNGDLLNEQIALGHFASLKHILIAIENVMLDEKKTSIDLNTPIMEGDREIKQADALKEGLITLKEELKYLKPSDKEAAENWIRTAELYLANHTSPN